MKIVLKGRPITKKNSSRIVKVGKYHKILPSKQFELYEKTCLFQIKAIQKLNINKPINLRCLYYMPTRHIIDLNNLLEATTDILVNAKVLEDDNSRIIQSFDGSRVLYDKKNPRVEIYIEAIKL